MGERALSDIELATLSTIVKNNLGLFFPPEKYDDLMRSFASLTLDNKFSSPSACLGWILSTHMDRSLIEMLATSLTVCESYFFREPDVFKEIDCRILPEIISKRRKQGRFLRIWSAACSTGEEAYSLAILLSEIIPDLDTWSITLLATDINPEAIQKAESGIYREWSFRSMPSSMKDRYFQRLSNGRYKVIDSIRNLVTFSYLNLSDNAYPSHITNTTDMDLILCRNVLMYFSKETILETTDKLQNSLVPGGRLITSMTEIMVIQNQHLAPDLLNGFTSYRKVDVPNNKITHPILIPVRDKKEPELVIVPVQDICIHSDIPDTVKGDGYRTAARLFESGDYKGAEIILIPFICKNPANHQAMALMARVLANQGDLYGAEAWCDKAIVLDKLNPSYRHLFASILQEIGQIDVATRELRRVLYADPSYIPAHFTLAHLMHCQGKEKESEVHAQNARELLHDIEPDTIITGTGGMSAGYLEQNICAIIGEGRLS